MALFIRLLALPAALHRATIYRALSLRRAPPLLSSLTVIYFLHFFCFLVGTSPYFSPSLCWCLAPEKGCFSPALNLCCWGSRWLCVGECCYLPFSFFVKKLFFFGTLTFFGHTNSFLEADAWWQRNSHWTESNFSQTSVAFEPKPAQVIYLRIHF